MVVSHWVCFSQSGCELLFGEPTWERGGVCVQMGGGRRLAPEIKRATWRRLGGGVRTGKGIWQNNAHGLSKQPFNKLEIMVFKLDSVHFCHLDLFFCYEKSTKTKYKASQTQKPPKMKKNTSDSAGSASQQKMFSEVD